MGCMCVMIWYHFTRLEGKGGALIELGAFSRVVVLGVCMWPGWARRSDLRCNVVIARVGWGDWTGYDAA